MHVRSILIVLLLVCGRTAPLFAQFESPHRTDSVDYGILPALAFSSDFGFFYGGVINRYHLSEFQTPFVNYTQFTAIKSTKGYLEFTLEHDQIRTFNTDVRTLSRIRVFRFLQDQYFGLGNTSVFDPLLFETGYYNYESFSYFADFTARYPIYSSRRSIKRLDWMWLGGLAHQEALSYLPDTFFDQNQPEGLSGGFVNYLGTGFMWENRDHEFQPTQGQRAEFQVRWSSPLLLSNYSHVRFISDYRQYVPFIWKSVIAGRLRATHIAGDAPFWSHNTLDEERGLRGYHFWRFRGKTTLLYSLEIRKWFFDFPEYSIKLGGQLFTDGGRLYDRPADYRNPFAGYHRAYGFGSAMNLMNEQYILRCDVAFSKETHRIYLAIGYLF